MICWKIRIFAYWTTPLYLRIYINWLLWFAEKFVSLLIEQHLKGSFEGLSGSCDLLKNSYLCLLNNTLKEVLKDCLEVVICWKIRIFAYWTTPKDSIYIVPNKLWFAEKFVSLLIEQHLHIYTWQLLISCDLLKNSYLCLLNNTFSR